VVDGGALGNDASWLDALRPGAQPWFNAEATSPPMSPPASVATLGDYLFDLSVPIVVARSQLCKFLRVAFRFWVTELRPLWMARRCHRAMYPDGDCVLLARITFDVIWVGGSPTGVWEISGNASTILLDETTRPCLAHLRLLQEWMLCGCDCASGGGGGLGGGFHVAISNGANGQILSATQQVVLCGGGVSSINLPPADPTTAGRIYVIKNVTTTSTVTVNASTVSPNVIDGVASTDVKKGNAKTLVSDGAGAWYVIGTVA